MPRRLEPPALRGWEDYWPIAVRRRWWIALPAFLCWCAVWAGSWLVPSVYESDALILVEQQKVPDQYVLSNVTTDLQDRLQSITQQILSRTRLEGTIDRFHLYPRPRGVARLAGRRDAVDQMRDDIRVELVRAPGHPGEFTAFKMHYSATTPALAQRVNEELTSLFVQENAEAQAQISAETTDFLESQLAAARARMEEQEAKVAAFKEQHLGNLPGQMESNVQILAGLQAQLQSAAQALDAARQHNLYVQSLLRQVQTAQASGLGDSFAGGPAVAVEKSLTEERLRLEDLKSRYTDNFPDIIALKQKIAETERLAKELDGESPAANSTGKAASTGGAAAAAAGPPRGSSILAMELLSQLQANQLEIQNYEQREKELESQISAYRLRLNLTPETEQQLTAISRGYEESKTNYNSLLQKQMQSQLASSLEQRQKGQQFRIVDPPSLPRKPAGPNRLRFSLGGLAAGIALGLGLAAFLEFSDVRVRREQDLEGIVPAAVLAGIPHLSTPAETLERAAIWRMELAAGAGAVILVALGNLYVFLKS
jgi:succinoglycan biosynthesis transport protein ExoP